MLGAAAYERVGAVADRAAGLVLVACRRRVATAGGLLDALGMPHGWYPLLRPDAPLDERLLTSVRADVMVERGEPRILELNIDGAVGGAIEGDLIAAQFQKVYADGLPATVAAGPVSLRTPPSSVDAFFTELVSHLDLAEGACLVVPVFREDGVDALADPDEVIAFLGPLAERGKAHGVTVVGHPLELLTLDERRRLRAGEQVVHGVFRLFLPVEQQGPGLDALAGALRAGTTRMYTPEATSPVSDKRILAWIWEDLPELDVEEQDFVRRHIPRTTFAGADRLGEDRTRLVLKPGDGYGGTGVVQNVPPDRLARVYSYDALGSFVAMPVGEMAAGPLALRTSVDTTLVMGALLVVTATAPALCSASVRRLTVRSAREHLPREGATS